jgi:hypothetical protein
LADLGGINQNNRIGMPLKTLVVIALRLFTIYWLVESIAQVLQLIPMFMSFSSQGVNPPFYSYVVVILWMLFVAGVLWISAFRLSSLVTKGHDTQLSFVLLTKEDLYCFAFVFLGVLFAISSIYSAIETGYKFFAFDFPLLDSNPEKEKYLWPFLGHAFTLIVGFAGVFGARTWTSKLIRLESKDHTTIDSPPTT